ncbi:toll-like receptor 13 isoform X1 [Gadus morhua]|uniref:toll-like receptor 13 isoform X1 n=2 Tax=Gadus morhua TaxID=8049 RepID=UPI0011B85B08|nr:toll-like receptor 13 isoform X1 [Gadus morhua]XP_030199615.1 toll-like receptor 13 isoform X1 [Gadus morhua]
MKTEIAMPLRGICFCSFGILYLFLNSYIRPTTGYVMKNCWVTQNAKADCRKFGFKVFPKDIPARVTKILLQGNNISKLNERDLENLPNLLYIDLSHNLISKIDSGSFVRQISLEVLHLENNKLRNIQEGMFDGLVHLTLLWLNFNQIQTVAPASFKSLSKLMILGLGHNKLHNLANILQHTPHLHSLIIAANEMSTFHSWELSNKSTELVTLDLSQNELMAFRLTADIFPNLTRLNLEDSIENGIVWEMNDTSYLSSVSELDISGVRSSLHGLQDVLETINSSLSYLKLNHVNNNLQALINISCKNPLLSGFEIRNNGIKHIRPDMLHLCTNLKLLDIGLNEITEISNKSFQSLRQLHTLIIHSNRLTSVPYAIRNTQISKLDLSCNNISVIDCDDFANMTGLKVLHLYKNHLSALKDCVFKDLVNLKELMLQNCSIDQLNGALKKNMPNLIHLSLLNNQLTVLDHGEFKALNSLQNLTLEGNKLNKLKNGTFFGLSSLTHLSLQSNEITEISNGAFADLKALKTLNLNCNHLKYASVERISYPPFVELSQLDTLLFTAQKKIHKRALPQNFLHGLTNLSVLDIRGNEFASLHPHTFNYTPNLNELILSQNDITDIPDNLFSPIQKLKSLWISQTNLRSLDFLLHANLTELEFLQVGKNVFSVIREPVMLSLTALNILDMKGNSFTCNCDNAWFLQWVISNKQTQVVDAYNFECNYPPNLKGRKLLEIGLSSCTVDMGFIFYISTACTVIMTIAVSFTHHFLQWHLVYAYYLMLAILYNSKNKDKRAHQYDAFVSYNANDEGWVLGELLPKLEDEQGWRLCLHHRDFQPGKPIMENITDAIYGSRKTICVVSRDYLESEWCSREIQVASFRLFDEQKDVLILVFLEEIPMQQLSPYYRMRWLLKRQTYLSWSHALAHPNLFWEKLRQALETREHPMGEHIRLTVEDGPPGERPGPRIPIASLA